MNQEEHPAISVTTGQLVHPYNATDDDTYKCPQCNELVTFRNGEKNRKHFAHKPNSKCSYYSNEAEIHRNSKEMLRETIETRQYPIYIYRHCQNCSKIIKWEIEPLDANLRVITEHPFQFKNSNRKADIACVVSNTNTVEFIIEICNTNPTSCEVRPEPWFELKAKDVYDKLANLDSSTHEIVFHCIRNTYCPENRCYGLCPDCEETEKGCIYHNQRGAGCGKTYESIQLIQAIQFSNKTVFIYLTKMHSAVEVIYNEIQSQFARNALGDNIKIISTEILDKHYRLTLQRTEPDGKETIIRILIGTIDSFNYAVCSNKVLRGNNAFQQLVLDIKNGHVAIGADGVISFAQTRPKLTRECLLIIDEAQDLEDTYIGAIEKIIDKTGIDAYIIGDKLQSILSEKNLFTKMETTIETARIKKSRGKNIVKRFHNIQFAQFVNNVVHFEQYGLDPIEGICDTPHTCGYEHEDHITPFILDAGFDNIYTITEDRIQICIENVLNDMKAKIDNYGYLPYNFCYIFLVVNERNRILSLLYPALESFWVDFFANPDSYTPLILENMRKRPEYWANKLEYREKDTDKYKYVILHRSELNRPINLKESENASRILSVHASKGTGCECSYFLGVSEMTLTCHTGGMQNLIYESLLHVGLTRQKKFLYVGYDGSAQDDVCRRFCKYVARENSAEPYIANISARIKLQTICGECTNNSPREILGELAEAPSYWEQCDGIIDFSDSHIEQYLPSTKTARKNIDWGHHIIRWCVMVANIHKYLHENVDATQQHFYAKYKQLIDDSNTKFVYCVYKEYKKCLFELNANITYNLENSEKIKEKKVKRRVLTIPILIFSPTYEKNGFAKYRNFIKDMIEHVIDKLKRKQFVFCPIETILYVYLMEMIQHPYTSTVSIIDIYHIIYDYDDCLINPAEHSDKFQCHCCNFISSKMHNSIVKPNQHIQNSIVNHYEAMDRIKQIMAAYNTEIGRLVGGNKIIYSIDKNIRKMSNFTLATRVPFIGCTADSFVHFYLAPQLSKLNIYGILTEILFTQYILKEEYLGVDTEADTNKYCIKCCIITLDSDTPIFVDLSQQIETKKAAIKLLLKDLIQMRYKNNNIHKRIFNYMEYHRINNITKTSYLFQIQKKWTEDKNKNSTTATKTTVGHDFPEYIIEWIKSLDKTIGETRDPTKRKENKTLLQNAEWVTNELDYALDYELNNFLGIEKEEENEW